MQHRSECLAHAADCRRKAAAADTPAFVAFYTDLEARWLKMADYTADGRRRVPYKGIAPGNTAASWKPSG